MWMSEIKIQNFRPFYGIQIIKFNEDSQDKFTIIEAKSDTGKTTFLSSICWCLYGKDLGEYGIKSTYSTFRSIHPFNLERKDELKEGAVEELLVEITLNNDGDKNPKYVITRKATCIKSEDKMSNMVGPVVTVKEWGRGHQCSTNTDEGMCKKIINSILPEDIHMFFLFEGEKLEKIFSFYNPENIEAAIEKVSQIQHVKSALDHLETVREKIYTQKSAGKKDVEITKIQKQIDTTRGIITEYTEKKKTYSKQLEEADRIIAEIDIYLSNVNVPLINEWAEKRIELEGMNEKLKQESSQLQEETTESLLSEAPLALCCQSLQSLHQRLNVASEGSTLRPDRRNMLINELLKNKKCLCGRSLDENKNEEIKKSVKLLKRLLTQKDNRDFTNFLYEGKFKIDQTLEHLKKDFIKNQDSKHKKLKEINDQIKTNTVNLEILNDNLKTFKIDKVNLKNNERESLNESKRQQYHSIAEIDVKIELAERSIKENKKIIDQRAKSLEDYKQNKIIADFLDKAYIYLEKINNEILEEVRKKVEKSTFDSFLTLHWDTKNYKTFTINENYKMSLKDPSKNERIYNIASGTKQVLLLSFISALADISGFKFPIFIDTPLANTDNSQRENIAINLPDFLKGNQVVLLVKDQEYTQKFRSLIIKRISQELKMVKTGGKTEVK